MQKVLFLVMLVTNLMVDKSLGCREVNKYAEAIMTSQNSILIASKKFWESQANAGECKDVQTYCDYFFTDFRAFIDGTDPVFNNKMSVFKTEKYAIFIVDNPL